MTGQAPLFAQKLHVGRPNLGDRERLLARIGDMLDRRWLTNDGPFVQEFEQAICSYLSVRHCVAVSNATLGLQIAIRAQELSGEVIVPSFTFAATVHALAWQGITPVFCDVDPATHNLDPAAVERLAGPRTSGILAVHLWGNPCDVEALREIANRRGLKLIFDAAHAFGCSHEGQMIGNFGAAEVFSFHATKFVNSAEGGAIVTNDDVLAAALRRLRNFGFEGERVAAIGTNAKMSEFSAAMGLTSLESRNSFLARNRENWAAYEWALADVPGFELHGIRGGEQHNRQYVVVEVDERRAGISRDEALAALHAQNVMAKRYFYPGCHRLEPYCGRKECVREPLLHTERLCGRVLQLPTGMAVASDDIERIGEFLRKLTTSSTKAA